MWWDFIFVQDCGLVKVELCLYLIFWFQNSVISKLLLKSIKKTKANDLKKTLSFIVHIVFPPKAPVLRLFNF